MQTLSSTGREWEFTTRRIVVSGMLGAISIVLGSTGLGFIPVPTPAAHATIMHVPAILGGVIEGPLVGLLIGLIFGVFSFTRATAPMFADPIIAIGPRLLIGVLAYYSYRSLSSRSQSASFILAGAVGTAVNTVGVLGLSTLRGYLPLQASLVTGLVQGIPEMIVAALLTGLIGKAVLQYRSSQN